MTRRTRSAKLPASLYLLSALQTIGSIFSGTDSDSIRDQMIVKRTEKLEHDIDGVKARAAVSRENKVVTMLRAEKLARDIELRELDIQKRALEIKLLEQTLGIIPDSQRFNAQAYDARAYDPAKE